MREIAGAPGEAPRREPTPIGERGERMLGFFHLATGAWLMYLTWAFTLDAATGITLWL